MSQMNGNQFTAFSLNVDRRRRRQFVRGLLKQKKAQKVKHKDGRAMYVNRDGQVWCLYEWLN